MGFWSALGKGLLKIAPIAASFIPGVGPLASMAIGAGTGALSKKASGGSLKDSLLAGGLGAASGYGAGKIAQGIGPSASIMDKVKSGANSFMGNTSQSGSGWSNTLGSVLQNAQNQFGGSGSRSNMDQLQGQPQMQQPQQFQNADMNVGRRRTGLGNAFTRGAAQAKAY